MSDKQIQQIMAETQEKLAKLWQEYQEEQEDKEDEDGGSDDGWEEVYDYCACVDELIGKHPDLQRFKKTKYSCTSFFQTYGGGPEGGYFIKKEYSREGSCFATIYAVERTWGAVFRVVREVKTIRLPTWICNGVAIRYKNSKIQQIKVE